MRTAFCLLLIAPLTIDDRVWLMTLSSAKFPSSLQERIRHAHLTKRFSCRQFADEVDSKWMDVRCGVMRHVVEQSSRSIRR